MKTFKFMTAFIAILLFSNLLFAGNPKDKEGDLADLLIIKMGKDVTLTDSQKVVVKEKLKKYIVKMQNAHALANNDNRVTTKKQATNDYQLSLDSILTSSQREQLKIKIKEREDAK